MRIAVGISGGVDSAVAAHLLKQAGHDVVGAMMTLWDGEPSADVRRHACYGPDEFMDVEDARTVCGHLGIPLHVIDCSTSYRQVVLQNFRDEYCAGRTPNPCVLCNQRLKFGLLPAMLLELGVSFDRFATGHYARVEQDAQSGRYLLKKGADGRKDQSYFIYRLDQQQLSRVMFPLGTLTKTEVRAIAREAGLPVHDKGESQDFYGGDLGDLLPDADGGKGEIVHAQSGRVLGRHDGIWRYTVGQRKGIGIPSTNPLYVVAIDREHNRVLVGPRDSLLSNGLVATDVVTATGKIPERANARIRSSSPDVPCQVRQDGDRLFVTFDEPQAAVTPGQSVVLYEGDAVVGGGFIERPLTDPEAAGR